MNTDDVEGVLFYLDRITKTLERIATALADDPDQYEYKRTPYYSRESASRFDIDVSVEGLRDAGFKVFSVDKDGWYHVRRPRGYEDAQTAAAESDARQMDEANDIATGYEYQNDIPF